MSNYDFIIIGGGSSGCVVASRLSEDSHISVLLLEAGPSDQDHPEIYDANFYYPYEVQTLTKTSVDWDFKPEAQQHAYKGYKGGGAVSYPRGKVLGGSSSINHMFYVRGDAADYDSWERLGCEGWSWKDVLPYFMKLENCKGSKYKSYPFRHREGPISVTNTPLENEEKIPDATLAFIKAGIYCAKRGKEGFAKTSNT